MVPAAGSGCRRRLFICKLLLEQPGPHCLIAQHFSLDLFMVRILENRQPHIAFQLLGDDPAIGINWPKMDSYVLSEKDAKQPPLSDLPEYFIYKKTGN